MAARPLLFLPAIALVLAGCTGSHGGHGEPALLLGLANELAAETTATWVVLSPTSEVVWQANATIPQGKTREQLQPLAGSGDHLIRVAWDGGNGTVTYDPSDCVALTHIVLTLAPEGLSESKRECHDDAH